jgi:hypothetical protein
MPSTTPVYNDVNFRNQFPAFENTTIFPPAQLGGWWTMASAYININNTRPWTPVQLQLAVDLMCAHLAASFTLINAGIPTVVVIGTTEGSVTVSMQPPPTMTAYGWWLATTPYGAQLRALLRVVSNIGLFMPRVNKSAGWW